MHTTKITGGFRSSLHINHFKESYALLNSKPGTPLEWTNYHEIEPSETIVSGMAFMEDPNAGNLWQAKRKKQSIPQMSFIGEGNGISSAIRTTFSGCDLNPVKNGDTLLGFVYEDEFGRHCILTGITPTQFASRIEQAREVFDITRDVLHQHGFEFTDIYRTWFYVDRILDWYSDFNKVRTNFFNKVGMFQRLVPASTGIGLAGAGGYALTLGTLALQKKSNQLNLSAVPSPLQCSAMSYQSSFSRAIEISTPSLTRLLISGTASIDSGGATIHLNNTELQIEKTFDVVEALLNSRKMHWNNIYRAIAYFRNPGDFNLYEKCRLRRSMPEIPIAYVHAHVCRHDLLFELEADAARMT